MLVWNHLKLWIATAVGLILVFASPAHWGGIARVLVGWNGAICVLVPLTYLWMKRLDAKALRAKYVEEDPTAPVIFLFTVHQPTKIIPLLIEGRCTRVVETSHKRMRR